MEGHGPDVLGIRPHLVRQALLQLVCRLVGEGNGKNTPGSHRIQFTQIIRSPAISFRKGLWKVLKKCHIFFCHSVRHQGAVASAAIGDEIGNPVNQHSGFSAAGTGQQKQRPLGGQHRLFLHGVQILELIGDILPSGLYKSVLQILCHGVSFLSFLSFSFPPILTHFPPKVKG